MNNGISSMETLADVGAIRGVYGGNYGQSTGSFVGNGGLLTVLDGAHTRQEVRDEGDQSAMRGGFSNVADNGRFYASQQAIGRLDDKAEGRFLSLDNKLDAFKDNFYQEKLADLRSSDLKASMAISALETQKEALQTQYKSCAPVNCSTCGSTQEIAIMINQLGSNIVSAINAKA